MLKIGFTNQYYTLWDVTTEMVYFTDVNGKHHPSRYKTDYQYIRNISIDIDKVKSLHPDLIIDEELRGKSRSYSFENVEEDLSPEIIKFGKYSGKSIEEISKIDFNYILWLIKDSYNNKIVDICKGLPVTLEYYKKIEEDNKKIEEDNKKILDSIPVFESGEVEITFLGNPNREFISDFVEAYIYDLDSQQEKEQVCEIFKPVFYKHYAVASLGDNHKILVFMDVKKVGGMYPYNMGIIDGKAKKLKNKTFKLNLDVIYTKRFGSTIEQIAIIK